MMSARICRSTDALSVGSLSATASEDEGGKLSLRQDVRPKRTRFPEYPR